MTSYPLPPTYPFLFIAIFVGICYRHIKKKREEKNRVSYSKTEQWAYFNFVTLGTALVYFVSAFIYDTLEPWYLWRGVTTASNFLVSTALILPAIVYLLLLARGKKVEAQ